MGSGQVGENVQWTFARPQARRAPRYAEKKFQQKFTFGSRWILVPVFGVKIAIMQSARPERDGARRARLDFQQKITGGSNPFEPLQYGCVNTNGEWPSGKALDFGSSIRGFESLLPSQDVHQRRPKCPKKNSMKLKAMRMV